MGIFQRALKFVLGQEGDYTNNPVDLGKATNKGITQIRYDSFREGQKLSWNDVKDILDVEVEAIYREIWDNAGCDHMSDRLAIAHFDCAVQRGEVKASKMLQDLIGAKPVDGIVGPHTLKCIDNCNEDALLASYIYARENRYVQRTFEDPTQKVFLKGWLNRLDSLAKEINITTMMTSLGDTYRTTKEV